MAEIQVCVSYNHSMKELSKSKIMYSSTARSSSPRRKVERSGISKALDLDLESLKQLLKDHILIKNAHLQVQYPSEERCLRLL